MPKYEIIYVPNSAADRAELETEIDAVRYIVNGKFIMFYGESDDIYGSGEVILTVASAQVLQVKKLEEG